MEDAVRTRPSRPHRDAMQISLLACLLAVDAVAQEPPPAPSPKPSAALQAAADELNALATEAEALVKKGDMAAAREVCQRALKLADLANASDAWLAAASGVLWRLGYPAYQAGDLRTAHDAWSAVHRHRSKTLPDEHSDLQRARGNLAATKIGLGDLAGALALQERAIAVFSRTLPGEHPDLLMLRGNLADTKARLGDLPGANALFEQVLEVRSNTLPDDHPDLQKARMNLASAKRALGDLAGALALQEKAFAVLSKTLPDDHPDLQTAGVDLAATKLARGDLPGALALQEKALAFLLKTLPDEHPNLQAARESLAATKYQLGDLRGANALFEQIIAARSKTLPDEHPDLQGARGNLAVIKKALGDLRGAEALFEQVLAARSKTLPEEHPDLQGARLNLATSKEELGDLRGALALEEKVLAVQTKNLPDDHPDLQKTRGNLATTKRMLGDLAGALALEEKVLRVTAQILPEEHPQLQGARQNLAITKRALGDLPGALALEERVFAVRLKTLPDEHPHLQAARGNLALTRRALGDLAGALSLEEEVLAVQSRTLGAEHPHLQAARMNLAGTKAALGDLPGALALQENAFAILSKTMPEEHPDLQATRLGLAKTKRALGDLPTAAQLIRTGLLGALARMVASNVSTRDVAELAVVATMPLSHVGTVLDAGAAARTSNSLPPDLELSLGRGALALLTATRSAQGHATELLRHARSAAPAKLDDLLVAITITSKALEDAIALPAEGCVNSKGQRVSRDDAIRDATLAKDAAERTLLDSAPAELRTLPTAEKLAAGLAKDEAAAAFLTYTRWTNDRVKPWIETGQQRFAALVLTPDGYVTWHSLAPVADVEPLIAAIRKDADAGMRLATRSAIETTDVQPGRDPEETTAKPDSLTPRLTALRDQLLAPVLAALPKDTKRIILSPADEMLLAPIEDLPLADGRTFGEAFDVQTVPSLRELVRKQQDRAAEPRAFVVGGIDYDQTPAKQAPIVPEAATPILEPVAAAPKPADAQADSTTRSGDQPTSRPFGALPGTTTEAEQLETLFAATFPTNTPTVLRKADASEASFVEQAPGKTFLHLATHGYFAPETYWKATDARDDSPLARFDVGRNDRTAQLSPFSLTGIALAGANLPPDELGRREGILTAQEITRLDLTACYLATLSACNTTLGVRRGGTGLASLRQAFHAAGARFVLATLWEVDDAEAQKLMTDFYTRLWKNGEEPRSALRAAKRAARERGAAFRDWAGWLITGR